MLAPSYLPRIGGVEKHVSAVALELMRRGLEVQVATPRWEEDWPGREIVEGVQVTRLSRNARVARKTLAPLVRWAEVVHTHDAYPYLKYYLPMRVLRPALPTFVTFHGYEGYPIPLEAKVLRRVVLWLTRGNICAGAFMSKWYRFKCDYVTHGGVEAPAECPAPGEGAVFVGRLEADTGFLDYLEGLRILRDEHAISMRLDVCGDGSLRERGEEFAAEAGLDVTFHGRVSDVMSYVARARFAFVSGLLAMLEAMAVGTAVLAVYDNPLKEDYLRMFPGAEHAAVVGSARELATKLCELVQSAEQFERTVATAYEFASQQTWSKVADMYVALYASAVRRGGAG